MRRLRLRSPSEGFLKGAREDSEVIRRSEYSYVWRYCNAKVIGMDSGIGRVGRRPRVLAETGRDRLSCPGQDKAQPQQPQQQPGDQAQQQQTFTGKIAKADGKFVLENTDAKTSYTLDDQDKAKQFEGQNVKVTGTLDAQSKTIHVSDIQPG